MHEAHSIKTRTRSPGKSLLASLMLVTFCWGLCLAAAASSFDLFKWSFWSAHGGLALLVIAGGNVAAIWLSTLGIIAAPKERRLRFIVALVAGIVVFLALAYPSAVLLHLNLNPPFEDDVSSFYWIMLLPFSWLVPG